MRTKPITLFQATIIELHPKKDVRPPSQEDLEAALMELKDLAESEKSDEASAYTIPHQGSGLSDPVNNTDSIPPDTCNLAPIEDLLDQRDKMMEDHEKFLKKHAKTVENLDKLAMACLTNTSEGMGSESMAGLDSQSDNKPKPKTTGARPKTILKSGNQREDKFRNYRPKKKIYNKPPPHFKIGMTGIPNEDVKEDMKVDMIDRPVDVPTAPRTEGFISQGLSSSCIEQLNSELKDLTLGKRKNKKVKPKQK